MLDIVRPQRDPLSGNTGLAAAIHSVRQSYGLPQPALAEIEAACRKGDPALVAGWLSEVRAVAAERLLDNTADDRPVPPSLILPIDQAEELFSAAAGEQAQRFLTLLAGLITWINAAEVGLIVTATIRTDRYEAMQTHSTLDGIGTVLFNELKPMPPPSSLR